MSKQPTNKEILDAIKGISERVNKLENAEEEVPSEPQVPEDRKPGTQDSPNSKFTRRKMFYEKPSKFFNLANQKEDEDRTVTYDEYTAAGCHNRLLREGFKFLGDHEGDMTPPRQEYKRGNLTVKHRGK